MNRAADARLARSAVILQEAADGTHAFKSELAKRKLNELRAQALVETSNWAAKNTNRRVH